MLGARPQVLADGEDVRARLANGADRFLDLGPFLGVGVPPPKPAWGLMLSDGKKGMMSGYWWLTRQWLLARTL